MNAGNFEALNWLSSENVEDFAANKFDEKKFAIEFIEKLYFKGALEVLINSESIQDESDGTFYADALIVNLPEDLSKRTDVLQICQIESQPGCYVDVKGSSVYLWWD